MEAMDLEEAEGLIALGCLGGDFAAHATGLLVGGSGRCRYSSVRYFILISCFTRGDSEKIIMLLDDWRGQDGTPCRPKAKVSKFVPGNHFHVLDEKFLFLNDAIRHLESMGYEYEGLVEKFVYSQE